jgi:RNA polymerase sigma factor (sigma-70 family)
MAREHVGAVIRRIERLLAVGTATGLSERQLLERFLHGGDEGAFEALVARHGPMVLGVCRQWLRDPNDVDDAFQATFLVLVRKAGSLRDRDLLGNWLYGVAYRVALRARTVAARRHARETTATADLADPREDRAERLPWLLEEVERLPERYRVAIVLCYLEGLTHEEAAAHLGWPVGTVKGRLARARALLRSRLERRGAALDDEGIAASLERSACSVVPLFLAERTVKAAVSTAAGKPLAVSLISAHAAALTEGVIHAMFVTKVKTAAVALVLAGLVGTGVVVARGQGEGKRGRPAAPEATAGDNAPARKSSKSVQLGDGSVRAAQTGDTIVVAATEVFRRLRQRFEGGVMSDIDRLDAWSTRVAQAEIVEGQRPEVAAVSAHLQRMKEIERVAEERGRSFNAGSADFREAALEAHYHVLEIEARLAEARSRNSGARSAAVSGNNEGSVGAGIHPARRPNAIREQVIDGGGMPAPSLEERRAQTMMTGFIAQMARRMPEEDKSRQSQHVYRKLEQPITMSFANACPLEDVLKYVKGATTVENDGGIQIYVDPEGLEEVDKKITSPVTLDLDGIPLKTTLRLALKQLGLAYCVRDGVLIISSVRGIYREMADFENSQEDEVPDGGFGPAPKRSPQ